MLKEIVALALWMARRDSGSSISMRAPSNSSPLEDLFCPPIRQNDLAFTIDTDDSPQGRLQ